LTSSDTTVATVPSSFILAPSAATQSFDVTGVAPGYATITAHLPPSAGGMTFTGMVRVYTPATLTATPDSVTVGVGDPATIALTFSPAPASPFALLVHASNANVQLQPTVSIDTSGHGTLAIQGMAIGDALVSVVQPDVNGAMETPISVHVADGSTMFVTSIQPANGPISGGTQVTLSGQDFSPACLVSFGGASATSVTFSSPMLLTATSPAHVAGTVDVTVTCSQTSTVANGFTYLTPMHRRAAPH
jgi:hypothetical protein